MLGTLLGIFAAWRRGGWLDRSLPAFTFLQATPYFFLALIAIQLFAVTGACSRSARATPSA